jgi:hypothetical protein
MQNSEEYIDFIDYEKFSFMLRKDGIVHYRMKANRMILMPDIFKHLEVFSVRYAGQSFLNLYEFEENSEIDDEVRKWAADPSGNNFTIADAFVIQSMAQKMIGNFYLTFHKPVKPTKLFTNVEDALKWLNSQR